MNIYKNLLYLQGYLLADDEAPTEAPAPPAMDRAEATPQAAVLTPGMARPLPPGRPAPPACRDAIGCAG